MGPPLLLQNLINSHILQGMVPKNLEICASRYLRGVYLYQEWKRSDDQVKKAIEQDIFAMFDLNAEELSVLAKVVESNIVPKVEAPSEDE